jgi:hypothetical protein
MPKRTPRLAVTVVAAVTTVLLAPGPSRACHGGSCRSGAVARAILWGAYIEGPATYGSRYGNVPWDLGTWRLFESHARKKVSIVHWGIRPPWEASFDYHLAEHEKIAAAGALEVLDMSSGSVPLREVADGRYDREISEWARQARTFSEAFFLRWDWEMNANWFPWGAQSNANSPALYVRAWRHVHDLVRRAGARNVTWVWCPNATFSGDTPLAPLYPGDRYVDWTCLDGYNKGGSLRESFTELFAASYDALLQIAPSKPIMIGETGTVEDGGRKAGWIRDALAALPGRFPQVKAFLWFNWKITERRSTWRWQIESSRSARSAFARAIASPYFAPGGRTLTRPPRLTPIEPQ